MRPLLLLLLLWQALPVAAQLAPASWQPPAFLYGYRAGRFEINATNPRPDNSLPEKVLFLEPDGAGGAFIVQNVKRGGYFPGLPASPFREPGTYLGRIDRLGRYQWVRLINRGGEYSSSDQLTVLGAASDGHGNILLWGQNKDTLSFDGHHLIGGNTHRVGITTYKLEHPFVMSFSQLGVCNWVHQIGSGNFNTYDKVLGAGLDDVGIWMAATYNNLDSTSSVTPFPLADTAGMSFFHLQLPSGQVDQYRTVPQQDLVFMTDSTLSLFGVTQIASDKKGTLYWVGALYNRDFQFEDTVLNPNHNTPLSFVGKLDRGNRFYLATLLPNPFAEVHDFDYRPESSTLRFMLRFAQVAADSMVLPGLPTLHRPPSFFPFVLAQMDTTGQFQWATVLRASNSYILGERNTAQGRETIWGSVAGNRGPIRCAPFGPDTLCTDPTQPGGQLAIWGTDSTGTVIRWGLLGGGSVSYDEFEGIRACMIEGPAMLVGTGADTSRRFTQAFFAGPFVDRSNQHNSLLVGVLLPQGSHPVATAPRLEVAQTVWPNPVGSGARLRWSAARPGDRVEVYDLAGRRMAETPYTSEGLQLPTLKPGMYLLRSGKAAVRVVVE